MDNTAAPDPNAVPNNQNNPNPNRDKKNSLLPWLAAAILLILLLIFHPWTYLEKNSDNELNRLKVKNDSIALVQARQRDAHKADSIAYAKLMRAKDSALLASQTLLGKMFKLNDSLAENCTQKVKPKPGPKPGAQQGGGSGTQRVIVTLLNQSGLPITARGANVITPGVQRSAVSQPANYNTETSAVDKSGFNRKISEEKLCFRFGSEARGWNHFPHLAVMDGLKFPELVDNKIGGYDLFIFPTGSVGDKDYGISADGTRYIKKSMIDKYITMYGGSVEGLDNSGVWIPVQFVGEFVTVK